MSFAFMLRSDCDTATAVVVTPGLQCSDVLFTPLGMACSAACQYAGWPCSTAGASQNASNRLLRTMIQTYLLLPFLQRAPLAPIWPLRAPTSTTLSSYFPASLSLFHSFWNSHIFRFFCFIVGLRARTSEEKQRRKERTLFGTNEDGVQPQDTRDIKR